MSSIKKEVKLLNGSFFSVLVTLFKFVFVGLQVLATLRVFGNCSIASYVICLSKFLDCNSGFFLRLFFTS